MTEPADELRQAVVVLRAEHLDGPLPQWIATMPRDVTEQLATMLEAFTGRAACAGWINDLTVFSDLQAAVDLARRINEAS